MSRGRKALCGGLDDSQMLERICYDHTKLNPNVADDVELVGYVVRAMRDVLAQERKRILDALPGGHSVDPQWVADMVRGLR